MASSAQKSTPSGQQEVTLILNRQDYAGTYQEGIKSFQDQLSTLFKRAGFSGEFRIKVFSYRLREHTGGIGISLGNKSGAGLEVLYTHSRVSIAEHVWIICYEENKIAWFRSLLQEELIRQGNGLPPLFKGRAQKINKSLVDSSKPDNPPVEKRVTSSWPRALALEPPPKPVRLSAMEQEIAEEHQELLPEPLPKIEPEVVIEIPSEDFSEDNEEALEVESLEGVPAKKEEQKESLQVSADPPKHIMDDVCGVAHVLLFLWAEADSRGKVWKGTLTGILKDYYGAAAFRRVNPAHQTFVAQGFLKRVTGEDYSFTSQGHAFLQQHESILRSSERVRTALKMFIERASHVDQERSIFSRDLARQARLGIERLRKFVG